MNTFCAIQDYWKRQWFPFERRNSDFFSLETLCKHLRQITSGTQHNLGGGFIFFFNFDPYLGKMNPFWRAYFSKGLVQRPTSNSFPYLTLVFCEDYNFQPQKTLLTRGFRPQDFCPPKQKLYSYMHISKFFFLNPKTCVPTQRHQHRLRVPGMKKRRFLEAIGTDGPGEFASGHLSLDVRCGSSHGMSAFKTSAPKQNPQKIEMVRKRGGGQCFFFETT